MTDKNNEIPKDPAKVARILKSARMNFAKYGYRDTKTDVIASEADVSKGIVFRYFGNKGQLFLNVVRSAYDQIMENADYSVWQNSETLVAMISRATEYKIQLQLKYPEEFAVLMRAYVSEKDVPESIRYELSGLFNASLNSNLMDLVEPVFKRLPIRSDVDETTFFGLMEGVMAQIENETRLFMRDHPAATIEDFTTIIEHAKQYVTVIERGITK